MWALVLGFFMILVDATIVSIATPAIMAAFGANVDSVVWVTSAYLLAYAVPLLITGRLGDRYGPKRMYLIGLAVFTVASLWCGLTGSIAGLVVARVVQGLGASILSPQTMAVITRTFPAHQRGRAMSLWGAVAGVAVLVGPIAGGLLVDGLGWQWIFFVNVPVGIVGFVLAVRLVPALSTAVRRFDLVGVALSAVGMFLLVFGIQEGQTFAWGPAAWALIVGGIAVLALFLAWQTRAPEPLIPLGLFHDRNFSLANVAITTLGLSVTAQAFPITLYAQGVRGLSPTPIRSNRRTAVDSAGTSRTARTNPTTPTGTLTMKIHCQPRLSTSRPPAIGPTSTATPATAPHRLIARPRWCAGNVRVITAMVCGDIIEAPSPCTTRATISPPIDPVSPHHREAAVKTARPIRYIRLGPNRSPSRPVISSGTA